MNECSNYIVLSMKRGGREREGGKDSMNTKTHTPKEQLASS
jgi:hypothetical protein